MTIKSPKDLLCASNEEILRLATETDDAVFAQALIDFMRKTEMGPDGERHFTREAFEAYVGKLADEVWHAPPSRDPTICINGIPLPVYLPLAGTTNDEMRHVTYATVGDLESCRKDKARYGEMPKLDEAIDEALLRAHGDREVNISEIIDR
jgi:hypothetical protein